MSVADKQMMVTDVKKILYDKVTSAELDIVSSALSDTLSYYDVSRVSYDNVTSDSNELISSFLNAKHVEGCSNNTIVHYQYLFSRLLEDLNVPLRNITVHHLRAYLTTEKNRGIKDVTLSGYRSAYCALFNWLFREGLIPVNPCGNLAPIRKMKVKKKAFTDSEIERLKSSCKSIRDKAIISFLLSTGCRIEEACQLNMNNIDFQKGECKILGKGNKERIVYINEVAALYLDEYFKTRFDNGPLFVGKGNGRFHQNGIRRMLNRIAKKANVDNVHPHRFRRTLATNLIKRGMPIQEVALILGHENINTTMKYIDMDELDIKSSYRKYS